MSGCCACAPGEEAPLRVHPGFGLTAALGLAIACASGPSAGPAACPVGQSTPLPPELAASTGLVDGDAERGARLFAEHCTRCHSPDVADRESRLFRGYPRLDCGDWVAGVGDIYLYQVISEGGAALGKQAVMKPFADQLTTEEISDLVAYLRAFQPNRPMP